MPDESIAYVFTVFPRETDLVERELAILVEYFLRRNARASLVVVDLDRSVSRTRDSIDDALHLVLSGFVEREDHAPLDPERFVFVEGVVPGVITAQTLLAELSIEGKRRAFANDPHTFTVVGLFPELLITDDDLLDARDLAASYEEIEPFEDFVNAFADEGFDGLPITRDFQHIAKLELLAAIFEAREARMAVERAHVPSKIGPWPPQSLNLGHRTAAELPNRPRDRSTRVTRP